MSHSTKEIDLFDGEYRDRVRAAAWSAIIEAVRDPVTKMVPLRNYEIYDAMLQLLAMILACSKDAASPNKMRKISFELAKRLRRHISEFKKSYDREGLPFEVIHTDEIQ